MMKNNFEEEYLKEYAIYKSNKKFSTELMFINYLITKNLKTSSIDFNNFLLRKKETIKWDVYDYSNHYLKTGELKQIIKENYTASDDLNLTNDIKEYRMIFTLISLRLTDKSEKLKFYLRQYKKVEDISKNQSDPFVKNELENLLKLQKNVFDLFYKVFSEKNLEEVKVKFNNIESFKSFKTQNNYIKKNYIEIFNEIKENNLIQISNEISEVKDFEIIKKFIDSLNEFYLEVINEYYLIIDNNNYSTDVFKILVKYYDRLHEITFYINILISKDKSYAKLNFNIIISLINQYNKLITITLGLDITKTIVNEYLENITKKLNDLCDWEKIENFQIDKNSLPQIIDETDNFLHNHIFKKNAFEVWEYLFEEFEINSKSRTDVKFIFEEMKKDGLIHNTVNQTTFLEWITSTYDGLIIEKTSNHSRTRERLQSYSRAIKLYNS